MVYHDLLMKWCMILERTVHVENLKSSYHFLLVAKIFHQNVVYTYKRRKRVAEHENQRYYIDQEKLFKLNRL